MPSNCTDSVFINKDNQNIVTGDIRIVQNNNLRMLFTRNPKCREARNMSLEKAKSTIIQGLIDSIDAWCSKYGVDKSVLMQWKGKVIDKDDEK